jgi:oligopeptide transport system substrate-binding protein
VHYRIFPETEQTAAQVLSAYEHGELESTGPIVALPAGEIDRIARDPVLSKELVVHDESATYFIVPNCGKKPFDQPDVRKALALVIDPKHVLALIKSPGKPADSIVPPGILGRNPAAYPPRPDVAKAKDLLAKAGYPNGDGFPEFTYTYNTSTGHRAIAEYLRDVWTQQLGLKVRLADMDWTAFQVWRQQANYDLYRGGWFSDYEDPNNWFNALLDSAESGQVFAPHWQNEQYDRLVRQARSEADSAKRENLYKQADAILADEMPLIPLYYYASQDLVKPYVQGWRPRRFLSLVSLKDVTLLKH